MIPNRNVPIKTKSVFISAPSSVENRNNHRASVGIFKSLSLFRDHARSNRYEQADSALLLNSRLVYINKITSIDFTDHYQSFCIGYEKTCKHWKIPNPSNRLCENRSHTAARLFHSARVRSAVWEELEEGERADTPLECGSTTLVRGSRGVSLGSLAGSPVSRLLYLYA